jgi:hypothetical protein
MKRLWSGLLLLAALTAVPALVLAQEEITPPTIGGTPTATRIANGQRVDVYVTGGEAEITFLEISSQRVRGAAVKTSGTGNVTVLIHWVNLNLQTTLSVGDLPVPFMMENGDVDKRSGGTHTE